MFVCFPKKSKQISAQAMFAQHKGYAYNKKENIYHGSFFTI